MAEVRSLLDVAAALADGKSVDWDAAELLAVSDADRSLLAELRFVEAVIRQPISNESVGQEDTADPRHWGPLRVIEHVRRGTFGDIYRAWDSRLDREVALKVLRRRNSEDEQTSTAIQEGRLLARVRHPNVVTVYGAERIEGRVGVWMEYVHGKTLEEALVENGPFDIDRVIKIGNELGSALSTVHRAGVIHRDVKAQNVMVDAEGRLVLTDFGAGVELEEVADGDVRELAGTPLYVAPEVLAGQPATPQSDIYSLGVLLYHLLTGTHPVRGRSLKEVREVHAKGARVPLSEARPDLPSDLVRIIERALDPDPRRRYRTPDDFGTELALLAERRARQSLEMPVQRRRSAAVGAVLIVVLSVGTFAVWRAVAVAKNAAARAGDTSGPTFTVIEFPGSTRTDVFAINDRGVIVGSYIDGSKTTHGFRLSEGSFTTFDFPGAVRIRPTGLNNNGAITGDFSDVNGTVRGFLWLAPAFTVIEAPGATYTRAESINDVGDIVGDYKDANDVAHGFFLSGGTFSSIDVPGAKRTRALRVNDAGHVVGDYTDSHGVGHGFLYTKGRFITIDVPAATVTQAFGINADGTIVGGYGFPSRHGFAFKNGAFTPIDVPGAFQTAAVAINSSGSIVGSYLGGTPVRTRGFLLSP